MRKGKIESEDGVEVFRMEPFFELSLDLLCISGFDGYFKKVNPAFCKLLGYTQEEIQSKPINEFIYDEDRGVTNMGRAGLRQSIPLQNFENRYWTKNGQILWLSWTAVALEEDKLIYAIAKNITHTKRLEQEKNTLLTNFTRINENLKLLTYSTSHDLRSPVNNLLMVFDLLDVAKIDDHEVKELIGILKGTTSSLKETLNKYVDMLGSTDGTNVHVETLSVSKVLKAVQESVASLIVSAQASFYLDFSAFDEVMFNRNYLESIFLNLITNSIKYARTGVPVEISISTRRVGEENQLVFADNGQGFDMEEVRDKIFGLHQRFSDNKDSKGIGLYLVHNHITSLGGRIEVESEVNEGAVFTITF